VAGSIPTIVRSFKGAATKHINNLLDTPSVPLWQCNYWEHIIRDEADLQRIQEYIQHNPARWEQDSLHPNAPDQTTKQAHKRSL
jgi:putative transposase